MLYKKRKVFLFSIIAFILTCFFSTGYHHFDEHFQILEFAGYKLNILTSDNLPWEFNAQIRSSFQPVIVICLYNFLGLFGLSNPFILTLLLRFLSALVCFSTITLLYSLYKDRISNKNLSYWFLMLSFLSLIFD